MSRAPLNSLVSALVHHYDELVDHLRHRFGDKSFAREVVQDVCVRLLEQPPPEPVQKPYPFLRRVSLHAAIDRYRGEQVRRAHIESVAQLPERAEEGSSAERQLAARRELDALVAIVDNLPPRCRDVFVMHKIHEVPQAEVARRLGISRQMVEKHLQRAMAVCRAALRPEEGQ